MTNTDAQGRVPSVTEFRFLHHSRILQGHIQPGSGHRRLLVAGSRKNPLEQIKEMLVYFCYITSTPHGGGAVTMHVPNGPMMAAVVPAIRFGWEAGRRKKGQCHFI